MRKRIYIFLAGLLFSGIFFLVSSCSKEKEETALVETRYLTLKANLTAARNDENSLGDAEYAIKKVRLYAFDRKKLDTMIYRELKSLAELDTIRVHVKRSSNKTLYVIVNEPDGMYEKLNQISDPSELTDIQYRLTDYMAGNKVAYNADEVKSFGWESFSLPMFGMAEKINTIQQTVGDIEVDVPITRAPARVDVYLQRESTEAEVRVDASTTLSLLNTCATGYILPGNLVSDSLFNESDVVAGPTAQTVDPRTEGYNAAKLFFTFYTPEHDYSSAGKTLGFLLKGVAIQNESGTSRKDFEIALTNPDGTPVGIIQRNCIYRVYATFVSIGDGKFLLRPDITITEWEDGGSTTLTPTPIN